MWQVTMRGIRAQLGRFFLTALSVMLGIAFLSGTLAFRDVLGQTFDNLTEGTITDNLTVRGEELNTSDATQVGNATSDITVADEIHDIEGVSGAYPSFAGNAIVFDAEGQPANFAQAPALAFGWMEAIDTETVTDCRGPASQNEIALEESTSERANLWVGDETVLLINGNPMDVEVVGIVS